MKGYWAGSLLAVSLVAACGANKTILESGKQTPSNTVAATTPEVPRTVDQEIAEMRTADFTYVYVLRRRDGQKMDPEDRGVVRANTAEANRRVSADGGKVILVGSNYQLNADKMKAIYDRFAVEDLSKPDANK